MDNKLQALLRAGGRAVGASCTIPSSFSAEVVAHCGPDYVMVDLQHGLASFGELVPMLQAIAVHGPTPLVRVPHRDLATAQRVLDAGAQGVIVPMVETRAEALAAVSACRYPPEGERSFGPVRARMHVGADPEVANREILCFVQVETTRGLEHLEEIAGCPGITGIYAGPMDLGLTLRAAGGSDADTDAALDRIVVACQKAGVVPAVHTGTGASAARLFESGFTMVTIGTDSVALRAGYSSELEAARGRSDEAGPTGAIY
jgi:4-hydroxy-2-oxoheptanedioate aldolase